MLCFHEPQSRAFPEVAPHRQMYSTLFISNQTISVPQAFMQAAPATPRWCTCSMVHIYLIANARRYVNVSPAGFVCVVILSIACCWFTAGNVADNQTVATINMVFFRHVMPKR